MHARGFTERVPYEQHQQPHQGQRVALKYADQCRDHRSQLTLRSALLLLDRLLPDFRISESPDSLNDREQQRGRDPHQQHAVERL